GVAHPEIVSSMILFWPVGGAKYRINGRKRFAEHLAFVEQQGLEKVVALVSAEGQSFNADRRGRAWAAGVEQDAALSAAYACPHGGGDPSPCQHQRVSNKE